MCLSPTSIISPPMMEGSTCSAAYSKIDSTTLSGSEVRRLNKWKNRVKSDQPGTRSGLYRTCRERRHGGCLFPVRPPVLIERTSTKKTEFNKYSWIVPQKNRVGRMMISSVQHKNNARFTNAAVAGYFTLINIPYNKVLKNTPMRKPRNIYIYIYIYNTS